MRESALGSVFIFQKRGIGLDNYKSKESLSRVVQELKTFIEQLVQRNLMTFLLLEDLEQDQMEGHFKLKNLETVLMKRLNLPISLLIWTKQQLLKLLFQRMYITNYII